MRVWESRVCRWQQRQESAIGPSARSAPRGPSAPMVGTTPLAVDGRPASAVVGISAPGDDTVQP